MKRTILIVEDDADAREMLSLVLTQEGFSVISAEDGLQALDLVKTTRPDLIITDINMPYIDGIELTKLLRQQFQSTSLPIVILTALSNQSISDAMSAGADRVIQKPMQLDSLLTLVNQILS